MGNLTTAKLQYALDDQDVGVVAVADHPCSIRPGPQKMHHANLPKTVL